MSISEFKAKCLAEIDRVATTGRTLVITRRGKPVARILPVAAGVEPENPLRNSVVDEGDLISPIDENWHSV